MPCSETKRQLDYPKMLARFSVLLLFVWLAAAGPIQRRESPITIPFTRRTNFSGSSSLREIDQARARALYSRSQAGTAPKARSVFNVPATNGVVEYTVSVRTSSCSSRPASDCPLMMIRLVSVPRRRTVSAFQVIMQKRWLIDD